MTTAENKILNIREPEKDRTTVRLFDDGTLQFALLQRELSQNELIKVSSVKVPKADPSDNVNNYIHRLPITIRESINRHHLYFHFTSDDFTKYDIDRQRNQIREIYPNFIVFWAFEFMKQDIVEFRFKQISSYS